MLRLTITVLLLLFSATSASPKSLAEYHLRLKEAINALDTMSQHDESESESARTTRVSQTIAGVRVALPKTDNVELSGNTVEVNNAWLHRELDSYQQSATDREGTLTRILERLRALEQSVDELDQDGRTPADKAAANQRLAEILSRPEYTRNAQSESALTRLWERLMKWLQQFIPKPKPLTPGRAGWITQIAQILAVLLALGVIAYVAKTFAPRIFKGGRRKKESKTEPRIVLGETLTADESASDILASAEALARRGELRAAIRKAYIALLVELGDRKILSLAQHKTNRDYLRAVRQEPLHTNVESLTDSFERHWYGLTLATDADWTTFRARYKQALQELN
ncbi:MAG TPA: DUF4129 domain-containing protein [Pyrinomonadaceae bacterium]|nr:DUF4129 domain-containing protein [Pyrinomonadaceae bacterium]